MLLRQITPTTISTASPILLTAMELVRFAETNNTYDNLNCLTNITHSNGTGAIASYAPFIP
ncbi:hypothetical protein [Pseudanabaena sp. UWO310]|uniref:hypothetical protein n=1 Tax=Pseudanabaena sp. UWO310 TaxID=2480795 RepID=UPI001159EF89|nr:hypothetical protein [Pseudanabaena sp. UWO310]TYQ29936.1 hypothetical protein PseudUWO310_10980 [Pseudanabaena sp. UWO310]